MCSQTKTSSLLASNVSCCAKVLFQPDVTRGVHDTCFHNVMKCDVDTSKFSVRLCRVVRLTTMFQGTCEPMTNDVLGSIHDEGPWLLHQSESARYGPSKFQQMWTLEGGFDESGLCVRRCTEFTPLLFFLFLPDAVTDFHCYCLSLTHQQLSLLKMSIPRLRVASTRTTLDAHRNSLARKRISNCGREGFRHMLDWAADQTMEITTTAIDLVEWRSRSTQPGVRLAQDSHESRSKRHCCQLAEEPTGGVATTT